MAGAEWINLAQDRHHLGFHKMREIYQSPEKLSASQKEFWSMGLVMVNTE
jgi:hypothetical protein